MLEVHSTNTSKWPANKINLIEICIPINFRHLKGRNCNLNVLLLLVNVTSCRYTNKLMPYKIFNVQINILVFRLCFIIYRAARKIIKYNFERNSKPCSTFFWSTVISNMLTMWKTSCFIIPYSTFCSPTKNEGS